MRVRASLLTVALGAMIAAPMVATSHTAQEACHGAGRIVTAYEVDPSTILYTDDRGFFAHSDLPPEAHGAWDSLPPEVHDATGYDRVPAFAVDDDAGGFWIYMESNGHAGLQTGGHNVVLGENGEATGSSEVCTATHGVGGGFDTILF